MSRRQVRYPNTSWGREAKAEDQQRLIDQRVTNARPRQYARTYEAAGRMVAQGRGAAEIWRELHQPPKPPTYDREFPEPDFDFHDQVARVRSQAIEDYLAGKPAEYRLGS